jgi:hypothetical protein
MFGWVPPPKCYNCGTSKNYKEDQACPSCGYLKPDLTKQADAYLIFCGDCGCSYVASELSCPSSKEHTRVTLASKPKK